MPLHAYAVLGPRFRASNISFGDVLSFGERSSLSKNASSASLFVATRRTRSPSQSKSTVCEPTAFTRQQWSARIRGCPRGQFEGFPRSELAVPPKLYARINHIQRRLGSQAPALPCRASDADSQRHAFYDQSIWSTNCVPFTDDPPRWFLRTLRACPSSIPSFATENRHYEHQ